MSSHDRGARLALLTVGVVAVAAVAAAGLASGAPPDRLPVAEQTASPEPATAGLQAAAAKAGGIWLQREDAPLPVPADHGAVWTGDALVAWGSGGEVAAYRHRDRSWMALGASPLGPLLDPVMVWTGDGTLVWGGRRADGSRSVEAALLDHRSGDWSRLPDSPVALEDPVAAWTGAELVAWGSVVGAGGHGPPEVLTLDLEVGRWSRGEGGPVASVDRAAGVWTGRDLLVWGSDLEGEGFAAAYHPDRGWRPHPKPPLTQPERAAAAWTGERGRGEAVLWGRPLVGQRSTAAPAGAALDVTTGRWRLLPAAPGYDWTGSGRGVLGLGAAWTGEKVMIVGGYPRSVTLAYVPATDSWQTLPDLDGVIDPYVGWTGEFISSTGVRRRGELLVWGGYGPYGPTVSLSTWRTVGLGPTSDARFNTGG